VRPALVLLLSLTLASPLAAQQPARPSQSPPTQSPAPAPPAEPPPPPYEPQLLRLAEILGALSYLRDLCGEKDGDKWRENMRALMEAEAKTQARKERLAGAFNRGFRGYEVLHRSCTSNAQVIIERMLDEGTKLSDDVANRFGGG
jgi:uncharacterized protein (TIGR02301 family)